MVPKSQANFFLLIYSDIPSFPLGFAYSLTLFETLFPRVPRLSVVIYVVKNASRPRPAACRRAPNGKRFSSLIGWIVTLREGLCKRFLTEPGTQILKGN